MEQELHMAERCTIRGTNPACFRGPTALEKLRCFGLWPLGAKFSIVGNSMWERTKTTTLAFGFSDDFQNGLASYSR
jgi:hypothetical protein